MKKLDNNLLQIDGCDSFLPALNPLEKLSDELSLPVNIHEIMISSQEQADQFRFVGSLTIKIYGIDLEPADRNIQHFGLT